MTTSPNEPSVVAPAEGEASAPSDFIRALITEDLASGKHDAVQTRFPPEPNGYLHIGHAKSIGLNFGVAAEFGGRCNLRFDDTNPATEDMEYAEAIQRDLRWLGWSWEDRLFFASDYFERFYQLALGLIRDGKAYVDSLSDEEIREYRGTVTEPGRDSPYRDRSVEENLDLFQRMRAGEFEDGAHVLRARIDMAAANMKMRDPLLYRIRHAHHYRTGNDWPIYPMYDYAHCLGDSFEGITHSLCTLEFENNREIYDWIQEATGVLRTRQIEFARLQVGYTVLSKRKLLQLVEQGHVAGWDDPRMPTLAGLRRRGIPPSAIRDFAERVGVAKANSVVDVALLEHSIRDDLNPQVPRVLCVLRPLKVVIENYPEDQVEELEAPYYPRDVPKEGSRLLPFTRELYIERDDFMEDPPKRFFRLAPGREVRLRYGYLIRCQEVVKDDAGEIVELRCTYDPETRGGNAPDGRKVKGTIHWVSATRGLPVEVRLYDRLFQTERPGAEGDFLDDLNPGSLEVLQGCVVEQSVDAAEPGSRFQFERQGYFYLEPEDSTPERPVFNRIVSLKDSWARKAAPAPAASKPKAPPAEPSKSAPSPPKTPKPTRVRGEAEERRLARFRDQLGLPAADAELLAEDEAVAAFFDAAFEGSGNAPAVANWVLNEVLRELKGSSIDQLAFGGAELGELVTLIDDGTISGKIAKDVFALLVREGGSPRALVEREGLSQLDKPEQLRPVVAEVLAAHPGQVAAYRGGKAALLGFFVGQVMKRTGGRANPQLLRQLLAEELGPVAES